VKKHGSAVPRLVYGHPSLEPPPKRLTERHYLDRIPATGKKAKPQKNVQCAQNMAKGRNRFIDVVNVRQGCV
jgi:hypothetical protein